MARKDRSGISYETLIESSLLHLGYKKDTEEGKNYLRPSPRSLPIIPGTYIQPDLVIRNGTKIAAIMYVTHWSRRRNSSLKFWRTWEESAQQKLVVGEEVLTVNCIFEALSSDEPPRVCITADDLPKERYQEDIVPVKLHGWDAGIGWAMVEAFDVSLTFPLNYQPSLQNDNFQLYQYDQKTSLLIEEALGKRAKLYLLSQWNVLENIRSQKVLPSLSDTHSRFRVGLLHLYLFYRVTQKFFKDKVFNIRDFIEVFIGINQDLFSMEDLLKSDLFKDVPLSKIRDLFSLLSGIYVRKGKSPEMFCTVSNIRTIVSPSGVIKVKFNEDLKLCLKDLTEHVIEQGFMEVIDQSFEDFDQSFQIAEIFEDLATPALIREKEEFVRCYFSAALTDEKNLSELLLKHAMQISEERTLISQHQQNWVLELILYLANLEVEDIYSQIIPVFERLGHSLGSHAPFGDENKLIAYLIQGKDICTHWSSKGKKRTLTEAQFNLLTWQAVAELIVKNFQEKGAVARNRDDVIKRYLESKSMRVISSDLNGFYIVIQHYLGDLCSFVFSEEDTQKGIPKQNKRICPSWQTDVIERLWGSKPLETWMTGISHSQKYFIKAISSQDGNEGHKTKELAGRCRALRLAWSHGADPRDRSQWSFSQRPLPKLALVLDGDWDATKKRNLYEAGWDWVGDVSQLHELRQLIQGTSPT